ncbi:MAG: hypothetical protein LBG89_03495, partial [Rickettsiales bacterium]|nr:hypothetical protein [Rickettsiales bacterium]
MEKRKVDLSGRKERAEFVFASVAKLIKDLGGNIHDSEIAANWRAIVGEEYAADLIVKSMSKAGV